MCPWYITGSPPSPSQQSTVYVGVWVGGWEGGTCTWPIIDFLVYLSNLLYMWQSRVEIEGYSVAYFDRIAAFEAPYH